MSVGKLCFSGKDFEEPRFFSVTVTEKQVLSKASSAFISFRISLPAPWSLSHSQWEQMSSPWPMGTGRVCLCFHCLGGLKKSANILRNSMLNNFLSSILASCEEFVNKVVEILEFGAGISEPLGADGVLFCFIISNLKEASNVTLQNWDSVISSQHKASP